MSDAAMPAILGVSYVPDFWPAQRALFEWAVRTVDWDDRIKARKTAGYGVPYNYAGLTYAPRAFPRELEQVRAAVSALVGWNANNCLLNYYPDGDARMGFHSDSAMGLIGDSGVVIVSLGAQRGLRFRRIDQPDERCTYLLAPGSLLGMRPEVQRVWQHALPRASSPAPRISLTFRAVAATDPT